MAAREALMQFATCTMRNLSDFFRLVNIHSRYFGFCFDLLILVADCDVIGLKKAAKIQTIFESNFDCFEYSDVTKLKKSGKFRNYQRSALSVYDVGGI